MEDFPQITDHQDRAETRLSSQLKEIPDSVAFVRLWAKQVQALEDAAYTLHDLLNDIDNGEETELNRIGKIIGQHRQGRNDTDYKALLKARVLVNNSQGDRETMIEIFTTLTGEPCIATEGVGVAEGTLDSGTTLSFSNADMNLFWDFLFKAKAAGVRLLWSFRRHSAATTFTLDGAAGQRLDEGYFCNEIDKVSPDV